jgi:hypothetical protein
VEQTRRAASAERFFTKLGLSVAAFAVIGILVELSSFVALHIYGQIHRNPLPPQESPAYDNEKWGHAFWAEQRHLGPKHVVLTSPSPFGE